MKTVPFGFQTEDMYRIEELNGRVLLANDMGLGKTLTCYMWMEYQPYVRPVIVVCPATLKENWTREAWKHLGMKSIILDSMTASKWKPYPIPELIIVNYDVIGPTKRFPNGGWLEWLRNLQPELIILDECSYIGSMKTKRTRNIKALCKGVPYILALSGTPFTNSPIELYPVLNILRPDLFSNYFGYASRYANPRRTPWGWSFEGSRNLDELHGILTKNVMIRRRKKDVLQDLPEKKIHVVPVILDDMDNYRSAEKDFLSWLQKEAPHKVAKARKAERLVRMHYLRRLAGKLKIRKTLQWINTFLSSTGEKLIVFAIHKLIVEAIKEKHLNNCSVVTGEITKRKRQAAFDRFNEDSSCNLFIGNIDAAGVGWSANKCSTVMFAELAWNPGKHAQAADRVHGINRGVKGQIASSFYLVGKDTIESDLCELNQIKSLTFSHVIDGSKQESDFNIFDMLEERIRLRTSI